MKDHEVAALVNRLRDIAVEYHAAQQLRERIAIEVRKNIDGIRQRIAALEAEKAERERQEPVAWAWNDSLGCMHVHCGSRRPHWVDDECSDSMRAELSLRPLYAHPLALREPTEDECRRIANEFLILGGPDELAGRVMFNAVREVMTK